MAYMAFGPPSSLEGGMSKTTAGLECCEWLPGVCGGFQAPLRTFLEHESPKSVPKQGLSALQIAQVL